MLKQNNMRDQDELCDVDFANEDLDDDDWDENDFEDIDFEWDDEL